MRVLLFFLFSFKVLFSQVWISENSWNQKFENNYAQWIHGPDVSIDIFTNPSSAYYGIRVDCADLAYALRAIFAFKNKLPFRGASSRKYNNIKNSTKRLIEFINDKALTQINSDYVSHQMTYPVKISKLRPGDIFTYSIKTQEGKQVKHVFVIKNINQYGFFDLLFSNPQRKGRKLGYYKNTSLKYKPLNQGWGFRRFKTKQKPFEYSTEQYIKAKILNEPDFWNWTQSQLSHIDETSLQTVNRHLQTLCQLSKDRVKDVHEALEYKKKINRCMTPQEYDHYSTPSRDLNLSDSFEKFYQDWTDIKINKPEALSPKEEEIAQLILDENHWNQRDIDKLNQFCYLSQDVHIALLYKNIYLKKISSDPNQDRNARWGLERENSLCPKW